MIYMSIISLGSMLIRSVIVGRRISQFLEAEMIPPAFIAVIERAKAISRYKDIIVYII